VDVLFREGSHTPCGIFRGRLDESGAKEDSTTIYA